jgi:DNA sulfur modification protein DndE
MEKNRLSVSGTANKMLAKITVTTGLTPNILARIGMVYSLRYNSLPELDQHKNKGESNIREFNRFTLFGNESFIYKALIVQWCEKNNIDIKIPLEQIMEAHLNRGAMLISKLGKNLTSLLK